MKKQFTILSILIFVVFSYFTLTEQVYAEINSNDYQLDSEQIQYSITPLEFNEGDRSPIELKIKILSSDFDYTEIRSVYFHFYNYPDDIDFSFSKGIFENDWDINNREFTFDFMIDNWSVRRNAKLVSINYGIKYLNTSYSIPIDNGSQIIVVPKVPVDCTFFTYSDWSTCFVNGQQTRTVIYSSPSGCSGGSPILTQSCIYSPTCTLWTYSDWSECINGQQTRSITSSSPENCIDGNPILSQTCQVKIEINNTDDMNNSDQITENNNTNNFSNQNYSNSQSVIQEEKSLITKIDKNLSKRVSGNILLQVEKNGEGWYVYPDNQKKYYLGRPADAFSIMRNLGLGIAHSELNNYLNSTFPSRLSGKIMLDVEKNGEAYYVNPSDLKGYYLDRPADAFRIMRELGLGITNTDIRKIDVGEVK